MTPKLLFVDDEPNVLRAVERIFIDDDLELFSANCGDEGLEILSEHPDIRLVVSDYRMPSMNGVEFLKKVFEIHPETIRIVLSGYADTAAIVDAINDGHIYRFIPKPWNDDDLHQDILKGLEVYELQAENRRLSEKLNGGTDVESHLLKDGLYRKLFTDSLIPHFLIDQDNLVVDASEAVINLCGVDSIARIRGAVLQSVLPTFFSALFENGCIRKNFSVKVAESVWSVSTTNVDDNGKPLTLAVFIRCRNV